MLTVSFNGTNNLAMAEEWVFSKATWRKDWRIGVSISKCDGRTLPRISNDGVLRFFTTTSISLVRLRSKCFQIIISLMYHATSVLIGVWANQISLSELSSTLIE